MRSWGPPSDTTLGLWLGGEGSLSATFNHPLAIATVVNNPRLLVLVSSLQQRGMQPTLLSLFRLLVGSQASFLLGCRCRCICSLIKNREASNCKTQSPLWPQGPLAVPDCSKGRSNPDSVVLISKRTHFKPCFVSNWGLFKQSVEIANFYFYHWKQAHNWGLVVHHNYSDTSLRWHGI